MRHTVRSNTSSIPQLLVLLISVVLAYSPAHALPALVVKSVARELSALGSPRPSKAGIEAVRSYVAQSSSSTVSRGMELLLRPSLRTLASRVRQAAERIKIDGSDRDWKPSSLIISDDSTNAQPIDDQKAMGNFAPSDDLKSFGCLTDAKYLYCTFKPAGLPKRGSPFHYRINLLSPDAKLIYAIVWSSWGNVIQEWDRNTNSFVRNLSTRKVLFSRRKVFEARVPLRLLPKLPPLARLEAATWHEHKNLYDSYYSREPLLTPSTYRNYALELLAHYGAAGALRPNDPFPLSQALVDAFPYSIADAPTKAEIIADGLRMLDQVAPSTAYSFDRQKKLQELDFDELLTWSDRSLMYGSDDMRWKFRNSLSANDGQMNLDIYHFVFMQPETLATARELLARHNLLVAGDLTLTARTIEAWLQTIWKYRSDGGVIEDACVHNPGYWCEVLAAYQDEIANNQTIITWIGSDPVYKWRTMSSAFFMNYLNDTGFYYGNCGDTTVIGLAFGKALGLPVIHIHYDTIVNGTQAPVHSFPAYFSSATNRYLPFSPGNNGIQDWKLSGDTGDLVYYYLEMPVISSRFRRDYGKFAEAAWTFSSNQCANLLTPAAWPSVNYDGVEAEAVKQCLMGRMDS